MEKSGAGLFNRKLQAKLLAEFAALPGGREQLEAALDVICERVYDKKNMTKLEIEDVARKYCYDIDATVAAIIEMSPISQGT